MAMANWMRPILFGDELLGGGYRWKKAPRVPLSELDQEEAREAAADLQFARPRWFFSQDRTSEASLKMFQDNLEPDRPLERAEMPTPTKLMIFGGGGGEMVLIPKSALRSCCVQKFLNTLHSQRPDFAGIKNATINAMRMIDLAYNEGTKTLAVVSAGRFSATLLANAESHFKARKLTGDELDQKMSAARNAANLMVCYAQAGDAGAQASVIPNDKVVRDSDATISVVRPSISVQVLRGIEMESHFPVNGADLFQ
jgi:hypothetical protein